MVASAAWTASAIVLIVLASIGGSVFAASAQVPGPDPGPPGVTTPPTSAQPVAPPPTSPRPRLPTSPAPAGAIGASPVPATIPIAPPEGATVDDGVPAPQPVEVQPPGIVPAPVQPIVQPPTPSGSVRNPFDLPIGQLPGLGPVAILALLVWLVAVGGVFVATLQEMRDERARLEREAKLVAAPEWGGRPTDEVARALRQLMSEGKGNREALAAFLKQPATSSVS